MGQEGLRTLKKVNRDKPIVIYKKVELFFREAHLVKPNNGTGQYYAQVYKRKAPVRVYILYWYHAQ